MPCSGAVGGDAALSAGFRWSGHLAGLGLPAPAEFDPPRHGAPPPIAALRGHRVRICRRVPPRGAASHATHRHE
mgnify:CR=1 FL=1